MRIGVALAVAATALVLGADAPAAPVGTASIRIAAFQPFIVDGQGFRAHERVRLEIYGVARLSRRVVATRTGVFRARFDAVTTTRCDLIRVVAVGSGGSRAAVKSLPAPACLAE